MQGATEIKVPVIDLLELFPPSEGMIVQYYGRIGNGKTYLATSDVLHDLSMGRVVYTNWKLNYDGYDSRDSFKSLIVGLLWPFKHRYYHFPAGNLRHISVDENFINKFEKLTDCKVYLDEGHVAFDSYEMAKMSLRKRKAVLHTRHYDRSIHIISQRATAVHVSLRANVNMFYKCEKIVHLGPILVFRRTEYQDMVGETVDEMEAVSTKYYWGRRAIMNAYDSKYLRGDTPSSQNVYVDAYDLDYMAKLRRFGALLMRFVPFRGTKRMT